jgi:hypothetical protein
VNVDDRNGLEIARRANDAGLAVLTFADSDERRSAASTSSPRTWS